MSVPFPLFPSRFSLPSFPIRSSQWRLWLTRVPSSPSLCIPFPPPPFPLFPALFPYWRLCPRPLSLMTIMFPSSFPIFDYVPAPFPIFNCVPSPFPYFRLCPDTLCPWCPYVTFTRLLKVQFYVVSTWVNGPDNYYLCTKLCSKLPHYF